MRGILRGFVLQCADDDSFASVLPLCDEEALEEVTNDRALSDGKLSVLSHWAKALRQTIKGEFEVMSDVESCLKMTLYVDANLILVFSLHFVCGLNVRLTQQIIYPDII